MKNKEIFLEEEESKKDYVDKWNKVHNCKIHRPDSIKDKKVKKRVSFDKTQGMYLAKCGYIVLRFWEHDINNRLDWCIKQILDKIEEVKSKKDLVLT